MKSFDAPTRRSRALAPSWWGTPIVEEGVGSSTADVSRPPMGRARRRIALSMSRNHDCITRPAGWDTPGVATAADVAGDPSHPLRLLIVEDNKDNADSLAMLLRYWGAEVRVCRNGADAVTAALAYRPDAALIDVVMPGINGYQLARDLRKHQELEHVVLIAMTGLGDADNLRLAREAGFAHHLLKPSVHQKLREILATLPRKDA